MNHSNFMFSGNTRKIICRYSTCRLNAHKVIAPFAKFGMMIRAVAETGVMHAEGKPLILK